MNRKWDYQVPSVELWQEVYRVLKPGGHVLSFGGTRTYHVMVTNMEKGGLTIRDTISWIYGSGFPKSLNIGKAIDKIQGNEREVVGEQILQGNAGVDYKTKGGTFVTGCNISVKKEIEITKGSSEYEGYGTALKPSTELICLARKPLSEKTIAQNVLKWGTGGLNIYGSRIEYKNDSDKESAKPGSFNFNENTTSTFVNKTTLNKLEDTWIQPEGRFPANVIFDEYTAKLLDEQSGYSKSSNKSDGNKYDVEKSDSFLSGFNNISGKHHNDKGGASRYFKNIETEDYDRFIYCAKASNKERNLGCDELEEKVIIQDGRKEVGKSIVLKGNENPTKNHHATVKPIKLMTYLCKLITPKDGVILDPFMGSGSTGVAALNENFNFIGCEMDPEYMKIAEARINYAKNN